MSDSVSSNNAPMFGPVEAITSSELLLDGNGTFLDGFGSAFDVNGLGTVVIGAPNELGPDKSAVLVRQPDGQGGYIETKLTLPDSASQNSPQITVAINDSGVVVVGEKVDGLGGALYVYLPDESGTYGEPVKLSDESGVISEFGSSVAIRNDGTIITGAPHAVDSGMEPSGVVQIFTLNADGEYVAEVIEALDAASDASFGQSVSINSSGLMVVGAPADDGNSPKSGAIYVYQENDNGLYDTPTKLMLPDGNTGDQFGNSVSVNDQGVIVVGAKGADADLYDSGSAYVYVPSENGEYGDPIELPMEGAALLDRAGTSIAIGNDGVIVVGAEPRFDTKGFAYVFTPDEEGGYISNKLVAPDAAAGDAFGKFVAVGNDGIIYIGTPGSDKTAAEAGAVYAFKRDVLGNYVHLSNELALLESADNSIITDSLELAFSDADIADAEHSATVSSVSFTGVATGLSSLSNSELATLLKVTGVTSSESSVDGRINLTFEAASTVFDYLATDEQITLTFTVELTDAAGGTATHPVVVTVVGTNDDPVVSDIAASTSEESFLEISPDYVDPDHSDIHTITFDASETTGEVTFADGKFHYDPNGQFDELGAGETATDTFTYTIDDGNGGVITKTVTVTINGTNDVPVVNDIDITVVQNTNVVIINADFSDVDVNDTHIITIDNSTTVGVVINNGDGTFSYDCGDAFIHLSVGETATDTFTYTIDDGNGGVITKTVTVTINGTNDVPVVNDIDITVVQNTNVVIINADFSDVDVNDTHIITIDNSTTVGVVINNGDGTFSYDCGDAFIHLSVGETATDTFTYTIDDGNGGVITKTVTVTINGTNDVPVVNDIDITVVQNTNIVIINADFSDVDV
ncbi:VCBS domain-containing protein, partial [Pseudovibrio sp. WM33]|uniref:VCBS domain-containing protein n=1 Tax=Pseudovibrio sp. WM33 TaxID=1735585 RepID=UPI000ABF1805